MITINDHFNVNAKGFDVNGEKDNGRRKLILILH